MKRRFKAKKKRTFKKVGKVLFLIGVVYLAYQFTTYTLFNIKLASSNEEFVQALLKDSNHHLIYEQQTSNFFYRLSSLFVSFDMSKPITLLEHVFGYESDMVEDNAIIPASDDEDMQVGKATEYMEDPNPTAVDEPLVYIYNTHQLENYQLDNLEVHNITPNVLMASYLLKEKLIEQGIPAMVEESNITEFMNINQWTYQDSYKASRYFIEDTISKYSSVKLFIDLHRDAIKHSASTVQIDGVNYAKILFVVGEDHAGYQSNLAIATKLNEQMKTVYPSLTRGIMTKGGSMVNGIYNQDLSPNMVLIELGGYENSIDEVLNTITLLSNIIKEHLEG